MTPRDDLPHRLALEAERGAPRSAIDVDAAIRGSRARRRPALLGTGVLATVAVVGLGGLGVSALSDLVPGDLTAADSVTSGDGQEGGALAEEGSALAPDWLQNRCQTPIVSPSDVPDLGLTLDVAFPTRGSIGAQDVPGTVRLTNTSDQTITGTTSASPAITLSDDGIAVWHTSGASGVGITEITLEPGDSRVYDAVFRPLECTLEDEARAVEGFDDGLEPLAPGEYAVSAILDVTLREGAATTTPVVSSPQPVRLEIDPG